MADITTLAENASPLAEDIIYTVDDPDGTPLDRKVKLQNVVSAAANGNGSASNLLQSDGDGTVSWTTSACTVINGLGGQGAASQLVSSDGDGTFTYLPATCVLEDALAGTGSASELLSSDGDGTFSYLSAACVLADAVGNDDGAAGQVVQSDGDGTFSWLTPKTIATDATWAAKGELIVATANDAAQVESVGANDTVLTADSACDTGVKWATTAGGAGGDITSDTAWSAKGELIVATANDTAQVESVGANNTILTADSACDTGVKWVALSAVKMETGSYTGDGTTSQVISLSDNSITPIWCWVSERKTTDGGGPATFFTSDVIIDDNANGIAINISTPVSRENRIIALASGSFTVDDAGSDTHPNQNTTVYNYMVAG